MYSHLQQKSFLKGGLMAAHQQARPQASSLQAQSRKKGILNYLAISGVIAVIGVGLGFLVYQAPWKPTAFAEVGVWGTAIRCGNSTRFVPGTFNTVGGMPILILLDDCSDQHPAGTIIDLQTRQIIPPLAVPSN
ncbi:MAG: hypothetical protein Q8P39_03910 [Candidatus Yanofskybacteria bacterium]|nr:hypothetical protein [Candidatus Yanofskybacteria bacterium]